MMLVGTVLGPGSIFIMLAGGLSIAFGLSNGWSFLVNLVPITIFIIICFYAKPKYQIQGSIVHGQITDKDLQLFIELINLFLCTFDSFSLLYDSEQLRFDSDFTPKRGF